MFLFFVLNYICLIFFSHFLISSLSFLILLALLSSGEIPSIYIRSCWFSSSFKTSKASTIFLPWPSIVFICSSKENKYNLACSIILIWSEGSISSFVSCYYLSILTDDNADLFAAFLLMLCSSFSCLVLSLIVMIIEFIRYE